MKSVHNFVVTPKGERYNNKKKIGDSELILNTEIFNHQYINREAKVISTPIAGHTEIRAGDEVIVHHNVFLLSNVYRVFFFFFYYIADSVSTVNLLTNSVVHSIVFIVFTYTNLSY